MGRGWNPTVLVVVLPQILLQWQILGRGGGALAQQQNQTDCSSKQVNAYISCVKNNPCLCSQCDPDPLDGTPVITIDQPPQDCQDINRVFCPLIRCCSACEDEARAWYGCTFQQFSYDLLGKNCPTTCSGFSYLDVEGDCQPSPSPSAAPTPCGSEADDFDSCAAKGSGSCTAKTCAVDRSAITTSSSESSSSTCNARDGIICPLVECCSDCSGKIDALSQCIQSKFKLGTECSLSCNDTVATKAPTAAMPSPSAAPISNATNSSNPVTSSSQRPAQPSVPSSTPSPLATSDCQRFGSSTFLTTALLLCLGSLVLYFNRS